MMKRISLMGRKRTRELGEDSVEVTELKKEQLLSLNIKNSNLQNKIFRLTPNTLDLDYLDEQIRFNIGKISPNEVKIVIENIDKELQ